MSKRLQVLLDEVELRAIQRIARRKRSTVAEWIRQALRLAQQAEGAGSTAGKLDAVRTAVRHDFPTGDIEEILADIERGAEHQFFSETKPTSRCCPEIPVANPVRVQACGIRPTSRP